MKAIIIKNKDDNRDMKSLLESLDSDIDSIKYVSSVEKATNAIEKYKPDFIFMHISMVEGNEDELLDNVKNSQIKIIVVDRNELFSLEAKEVSTTGLILKKANLSDFI